MFTRLLKYDFRSMWKQFALIWPAALAVALLNRYTVRLLDAPEELGNIAGAVAMMVYVGILIAMFVIAVIFVIQRFYRGLLGDEGYLMHTLPVPTWQLILSKLLCAVVVTVISLLVAILSILLVVPIPAAEWLEGFRDLGRLLPELLREHGVHAALVPLELLAVSLAGLAGSFLHMYLAMAIGHLFHRNRVAMSVVAYIAVNAALSAVSTVLTMPLMLGLEDVIEALLERLSGWTLWHLAMLAGLVLNAFLAALFFFLTEVILRRKLNLE